MNATPVLPAQITAFAAEVRAALADLPADEVDELTEGLEADLAEAYAEDLARELPDPVSYAAELRGAAGLPTPEPRRGRIASIGAQVAGIGADLRRSLRANPATAAALDFLATLRPAWWIARAWAAFQCFGAFFGFEGDLLPADLVQWALLLVLIAGSVFLGQRTWPTWARFLIGAGNVIAVVTLIFALPQVPTHADLGNAWDRADSAYDYEGGVYDDDGDGTGVYLNGNEVTNIFAYDARGRALTGVQLFDQDGKPLTTSVPGGNGCLAKDAETGECTTPGAWVPTVLETGAQAWNVFPMTMAESSYDDPTKPIEGAVPQDRPAPFLKVPALFSAVQQDAEVAKDAKDAKAPR
ncbi:hypothetical protein GL325_06520 [Aeromicrobium sp. 636]|uniref:Uncharacterized protein n=1 Tax=Aeromicrobium senzhongii TaxID=2663859 RepID=A0A8I0K043_9ACTN|nr:MULTISPECIES: hypothetical protein [Aeromicrobium]MBC9225966.1 hypothetical protein [Aeromicrobium senzhongii]MCQ3998073.1 hypothetical protein [Aeromicrobium sp. 636]